MNVERFLETRHDIPFIECLLLCARNDEFVAEWERLSGHHFPHGRIEQMVDAATGYDMNLIDEFVDFVYRVVFCTL